MLIALVLHASAADTVHAKFGWVPGDAWAVTFERATSRTGGGPPQETKATSRWTATVAGTPGALEIHTSDYALDGMTGFLPSDLASAYIAAMFAAAPSFRLAPDGALGELLDAPVARAAAEKVLDANRLLTRDARAQLRASMPDAQLQMLATDWWGTLVASWIDAELAIGDRVGARVETPVPILGNVPVGLDIVFAYEGAAACVPGGPSSCEVFTARSALDPKGVSAALETFTNNLAAAQGATIGMRVDALLMDTTSRLVTEADDLRPRSLVIERVTKMSGEAQGDAFDVVQSETRTWTFTPVPKK